ncbi:MAG: isoprenyl transferase [Acidobacteriota bacterium]
MSDMFENIIKKGSPEEELFNKIDKNKIPNHVSIIMDGNGRWAKKRDMSRINGHKEGAKAARKAAEYAARLGIKYLTLFTFSSENWKRPAKEVNTLMKMLYENLVLHKNLLTENDIKLSIIGDMKKLPNKLIKKINETIDLSKSHKKMTLCLALNYGSRSEIIDAVKNIIKDKVKSSDIDEKRFTKYLYTKNIPDPDLLVRTSGEQRISNFLLYQIAYTELYFSEVLWPDFGLSEFLTAILAYQDRERRYGKI